VILGRGTAQTDDGIVAEYHRFLDDSCQLTSTEFLEGLKRAPGVMLHHIAKPIAGWAEEEIIDLLDGSRSSMRHRFSGFVAFLLLRGYCRPTFDLLASLRVNFASRYKVALKPWRERLEQARDELRYGANWVGGEMNLLVWLSITAGKPLDELTRADFDRFRDDYQAWYRRAGRGMARGPNSRVSRLEHYLVHLGIIPEAEFRFCHEEYFSQLHHDRVRAAALRYMQMCDAKYKRSTISARRGAVVRFFEWLQERHPDYSRLDDVTRATAMEYARHLKAKVESGDYSLPYRNQLYMAAGYFFEFGIEERLPTFPERNPFVGRDIAAVPNPVPRYLPDHELRAVIEYCNNGATLKERTIVTTLLHTGIRAAELTVLKASDVVQIQGRWKLHVHQGKGLKDRVIPLTAQCLAILQTWQEDGWERVNDFLFTRYGQPWRFSSSVGKIVRSIGERLDIEGLTPHRFRHTFAVALLNYGIRESALQRLLGHSNLDMTLQYGRILDRTVEREFNRAVERMETGPLSWVPNFFAPQDYALFAEGDTVNWIRLPHGYCRRHHGMNCESDVKCLLCERFVATPADLPVLQEVRDRFLALNMRVKADVVSSHICQLEAEMRALEIPRDTQTPQCWHPGDEAINRKAGCGLPSYGGAP
jgi:site-specific recombinase XerD